MKFGSVCSGIEAASVAWGPLGWEASWFAEIEPFPSAVLAHHYPAIPNLGDMTKIARQVLNGAAEAPDVLCGGTPCQAFSVAGLRQSLGDARGGLTLKFVELADAIDHVRGRAGKPESIVFWENVPGVLSTKDNAFGCFLGALVGESDALVPAGGRWTDAGCVYGPKRAAAWRVLDAQYFGLAQRRRRVFVVASARSGFDPAAVLFERDGVRRDTAPSRSAGQGIARRAEECFGGNRTSGARDVASALSALSALSAHGGTGRHDFETETFVTAHTLRGEGFDAGEDGTGRGTPLVPVTIGTLDARTNGGGFPGTDGACSGHVIPVAHVDVMPTIRAGASNGGAGHGARSGDSKDELIVPVAFPANLSGTQCASAENLSPSLGALNPTAVATRSVAQTITSNYGKQCDNSDTSLGPNVAIQAMQVRRLTPTECERLQGFPDGYTAIPWRKKPATECPDGPRYKALGNSWAVPNVRWIGRRIAAQIAISEAA